jgi:hypothetical protein
VIIDLFGILTGELKDIVRSKADWPGFVADLVTFISVITFGR